MSEPDVQEKYNAFCRNFPEGRIRGELDSRRKCVGITVGSMVN